MIDDDSNLMNVVLSLVFLGYIISLLLFPPSNKKVTHDEEDY